MPFSLFDAFERVFSGTIYRHRASTQGDQLARLVYEDLHSLHRSLTYNGRVDRDECAVTGSNIVTGIRGRRGDGTFGESLPTVQPVRLPGLHVAEGPTANIQIGIEVKIIATAMIKQIDRVTNDLRHQANVFRNRNPKAVTLAIVGINFAEVYESYEGERSFVKEGRMAPLHEAPKAMERLGAKAKDAYDELLYLQFRATNQRPFAFSWRDRAVTENEYGAVLVRLLRLYESRF